MFTTVPSERKFWRFLPITKLEFWHFVTRLNVLKLSVHQRSIQSVISDIQRCKAPSRKFGVRHTLSICQKKNANITKKKFLLNQFKDNYQQLKGSVKEPNISIYLFFPPIIQLCSVSDVLFTGVEGVSDFSVLK